MRIAQELGRRRPDIPLLVVESRGTRHTLGACGLMTADHPDIQVMPITTDPRRFWSLTKILLMPSLWWETQGLVAVEAMINGIPVVGSDRGAIPETLGQAGIALPLPERLTPVSRILPTAEEMEPWVEAIIRLWDDPAWYQEQSIKATNQGQLWHPDRLRPLYAEFFQNVQQQPRPPMMAAASEPVPAGRPIPAPNGTGRRATNSNVPPLSFVVCVSDNAILKANLQRSPCLAGPGSPHEVLAIHDAPSAAAAINLAIPKARHQWVACVHQDVFLPDGWDRRIAQQLEEAERRFGPIGVVGVYGVGEVIVSDDPTQRLGAMRIGWVNDRGRLLRDGPELPARVATLDELLLIVRRDTPLQFDPNLGFHFYGADLCLQANEQGLAVVALRALCHHNSRGVGLPETFYRSAEVFARKWSHRLPVATPCVIIDKGGEVYLLGNAADGAGSIAQAEHRHVRGSAPSALMASPPSFPS